MVVGATTNPPLVTPLAYSGSIRFDNAIDLAQATGLAPSTVDPDFKVATTQSWNLNLQRELARNVALLVGYFGAKGSDLQIATNINHPIDGARPFPRLSASSPILPGAPRSEEHTSELQSRSDLVCRLLLEKKNRPLAYS